MNARSFAANGAHKDELPELARLMADSPLLARYGVTFDGALASLLAAHYAEDVLLVGGVVAGPTAIGPIAGFAWLSFAPRMLNGAAYLRLLLIDAHAQGSGLGTLLLDAAERTARDRGNHVYLLATTDNVGARRFYERHGYRHVGDLPGLVRPELDEALYHKALRGPDERLSG